MSRVIDAHQHFLDPDRHDYPWLTDGPSVLRQRYGPEELAPLLSAAGVDGSVVVQTHASVREGRESLALAAANPSIVGVVAWADLTDPAIGDTIGELRAGLGGERLVGIRHQVQDESDPAWLVRPDVQRGIGIVGALGLAYDLLLTPREMPAGIAAVRAFPEIQFVLDHLSKPPIASGDVGPWAGLLTTLAGFPNVSCKLSGLVTEAAWDSWTVEQLRPAVQHAFEVFGPGRILFGSDWPVCLLAATYEQVVDTARALSAGLSETESDAVFGGNAERIYRLS